MKTLITLLMAVALVYALFGGMVWFLQERLVFLPNLPGRALTATPENLGFDYEDVWLETGDGVRIHGWFVRADSRRGTMLFFHGNAGNISHRLDSLAQFRRLGLDVFVIDYRGYGLSEGVPDEAGLYRDAEAAWRHLTEVRGIPADDIVVFGRSMGGAVAAGLAARETPGALIVESSFTSARDMARRLYPFLPTSLLLRLRFPVREFLERVDCPTLVVHARQDEIIPFHMGEALHLSAPEPRRFLELSGDHNTAFLTDEVHYLGGLDRFLASHLGDDER